MVQVPAIRIQQQGPSSESPLILYLTALTLGELLNFVEVDRWGPDNDDGYQRPLTERRLREIGRYILEQQGILPTSVLVSTRPDQPINVAFKEMALGDTSSYQGDDTAGAAGQLGLLTIPEGAILWLVDGQNRVQGVNNAYQRGDNPELEAYPFPVAIMDSVTQYDEMVHFNIINTEQKKMATDIVDRHMLSQQRAKGIKMMESGSKGQANYLRANTVAIVDALNEEDCPWKEQIQVPGVPGRDNGLVRQHAMVASLAPVMKDPWVQAQQPQKEHLVKLLANYWNALSDVWEPAFQSPGEYRVQATVGIYSLHMLLPTIIQRCLADRDLSRENIRKIITSLGIDASFWHKEDGDPLTIGTGMASIRYLYHTLADMLPSTSPAAVRL